MSSLKLNPLERYFLLSLCEWPHHEQSYLTLPQFYENKMPFFDYVCNVENAGAAI